MNIYPVMHPYLFLYPLVLFRVVGGVELILELMAQGREQLQTGWISTTTSINHFNIQQNVIRLGINVFGFCDLKNINSHLNLFFFLINILPINYL